jgi:hypothetical protein
LSISGTRRIERMLLVAVIVVVVVVLVVAVGWYYSQSEAQRRVRTGYRPESQEPLHRGTPGFNPATGQYEDRDGTPYGAIEDTLMAADEDGF